MNKKELTQAIAEQAELSIAQAERALEATLATISQTLVSQDTVVLPKFGSFGTKLRAARQGRNPSTGEVINIPESVTVYFKPASQLKTAVKESETSIAS